ncbi:3-hydroxyacyl-CoA dehydrogenase NAD-binding domain-containing protein, partial [Vibrio chagasii]|uniref:3-hydroxyacyl-CoA dehydrogenase NAD-binding domain-containing protein n=1 Tax=Vibrio chagasii TaxID=170679 RepID=UPI0040680E9C
DYLRKLVEKQVQRGRLHAEQAEALLARIKPTTRYTDLDGAELVIEAVFEQRDIKADVTRQAEAVLSPDAIFASNTSTLPITGLAE